MKELNALWPKGVRHEAQARDVTTWSCKACDKSRFHRIGHSHDDDRDRLGSLFRSLRRRRIDGDNHLNAQPNQLVCKSSKPLVLSFRVAQFDLEIGSLHIAELLKLVEERFHQAGLKVLREYANPVTRGVRLPRVDPKRRDREHSNEGHQKLSSSQIHHCLRQAPMQAWRKRRGKSKDRWVCVRGASTQRKIMTAVCRPSRPGRRPKHTQSTAASRSSAARHARIHCRRRRGLSSARCRAPRSR